MKKFILSICLSLVFAFAISIHAAETENAKYIDGNWFQLAGFTGSESNYGGDGDTHLSGVNAQVAKYQAAKELAEADLSDIASREDCEKLAVRSNVRGQYALEVGRLYLKAGDKAKAKAAYERAKAWGEVATKADYSTDSDEENQKVSDNKEKGAWVITVANRQLKKCE